MVCLGRAVDQRYDYSAAATSTINEQGSVYLTLPASIDQIALENLRVQGGHTPALGNVFINSLELNNSAVTITPH